MNPLVSIIIPTYNRAQLILETIDSIIAQTYEYWECIVVDDGSTDNTAAIVSTLIASDSRIRYYQRPTNKSQGANACRNYGLEVAKGTYINFFDSDDLMHKEKLAMQVSMLDASDADFNVCQTLVFEGSFNGTGYLRNAQLTSSDPFNDFISHRIKWLTQSPMLKKELLDKTNLKFDEQLQQSQELDFFGRLLALNTNYNTIDKPLVFLRTHSNSISHGIQSPDKLLSSFRVRISFVKNYNKRLTAYAYRSLVSESVGLFSRGLKRENNFKFDQKYFMYKELKDVLNKNNQKILLIMMCCSYRLINKGDVLKARLQSSI